VRPLFTVTASRAPRVTIGRDGTAVVLLGLRIEARALVSLRVLGPDGKIRKPIRAASTIDGTRPAVTANRLRARLKDKGIHGVRVAFAARPGAARKIVRIVLVATSDLGDATQTIVRVRVPL
jgi:hypothetical protein